MPSLTDCVKDVHVSCLFDPDEGIGAFLDTFTDEEVWDAFQRIAVCAGVQHFNTNDASRPFDCLPSDVVEDLRQMAKLLAETETEMPWMRAMIVTALRWETDCLCGWPE